MKLKLTCVLVLLSVTACKHATETRGESGNAAPGDDEKAAAANKKEGRGDDKPARKGKSVSADPLATSKTTRQMFKPDGLKKLQTALGKNLKDAAAKALDSPDAGMLPDGGTDQVLQAGVQGVNASGALDPKTQDALRAYQHSQGLPETGLPDYETLRRLGLKPDEVFHSQPPGERVGVE